ncbi:MAG: hypothetical protein RR446_06775 [Lachnospiraceae bacterium]
MMRYLKDRKVQLVLAAIILITALATTAWYQSREFAFDKRTGKQPNQQELQEKVQKNADDSQFQIRINSRMELDTPDSEAALYIRNLKENKYDIYVELISDTSGKTVYTSEKLKPGDSVERDYLDGVTGTGEQPYTAYFHILEKGKEISTIEYAVTVVLKES